MGRKKKKSFKVGNPLKKVSLSLEDETKHSALAIIFLVFGIFFILAFFNLAGVAGEYTYETLKKILGAGYFLLPIVFFLLTFSFWKSERPHIVLANSVGGLLFLASGLGLIEIASSESGGLVGRGASALLIRFFGPYASVAFLLALLSIGALFIFNTKLSSVFKRIMQRKKSGTDDAGRVTDEDEYDAYEEETEAEAEDDEEREDNESVATNPTHTAPIRESDEPKAFHYRLSDKEFVPPPLSLLERDSGKPGAGDISANKNIIKRTLKNFGIDVEVDDVSIGPSITRYAIKPAEGVRLSRIVALQNDLSLALAAHPLRIEAPIPGKSLVGIEIPNAKKSLVGIASLLGHAGFTESKEPLLLAIGRAIDGEPIFTNLARAPHLLVAGATGSGKSVSIHSIIASLLYRTPPEFLRFIMIDPKRVELTLYNGIPHLVNPVITNAKQAILALKWAIRQMEDRYNILEAAGSRNIQAYHKNILEPELKKARADRNMENAPEPMPYIVIIIDELADIMATYQKELESSVVRLAQMSRAVGIHLILSTQRPSVNVITGLIKANIPARVALQVASQVDSRTILDMAGAEKLLGSGDMLYMSGEMSKPVRLQSPFVSEAEVKRVVAYFKKEYGDTLPEGITFQEEINGSGKILQINLDEEAAHDEEDDLYETARDLVVSSREASVSDLQRRLGIGFPRAGRIMDMLERRGIVGPADGTKKREVYGTAIDSDETVALPESGEDRNQL